MNAQHEWPERRQTGLTHHFLVTRKVVTETNACFFSKMKFSFRIQNSEGKYFPSLFKKWVTESVIYFCKDEVFFRDQKQWRKVLSLTVFKMSDRKCNLLLRFCTFWSIREWNTERQYFTSFKWVTESVIYFCNFVHFEVLESGILKDSIFTSFKYFFVRFLKKLQICHFIVGYHFIPRMFKNSTLIAPRRCSFQPCMFDSLTRIHPWTYTNQSCHLNVCMCVASAFMWMLKLENISLDDDLAAITIMRK